MFCLVLLMTAALKDLTLKAAHHQVLNLILSFLVFTAYPKYLAVDKFVHMFECFFFLFSLANLMNLLQSVAASADILERSASWALTRNLPACRSIT